MRGLSTSEAHKRLLQFGKNVLEDRTRVPMWKKFLGQFTDLMVLILIGAAVIAIGSALYYGEHESLIDGYVILGIVVLNACIGFYQEYKADKAIEALRNMVSPQAIVVRGGKKMKIASAELVPGDLLIMSAGDKVSADCKLVEISDLQVDESALTGESVPVLKHEDNPHVFMGTHVLNGSAMAVVEKTGMSTEFGKIATLTTGTERDSSPLQLEMMRIGVFVGKVTFVLSSILYVTGILLQGQTVVDSLLFAVSVAVAAVPEGLPATITIALAIGVQRLAKKHAIMKKLSAVETLGSTTVICSDKTGTLTKNEMTVRKIYVDGQVLEVSGSGYDPKSGEIQFEKRPVDLDKLLEIGLVCNDSSLVKKKGKYSLIGDPTEGALVVLAHKIGLTEIKGLKREKGYAFDSVRKMMSVVVKRPKSLELWLKGSPENVMGNSTMVLDSGKARKMTDKDREMIKKQYEAMGKEALRVLALAYRQVERSDLKTSGVAERNLVFVGLVGIIDPPREEVKDAVKLCHQAGIRTLIMTGDYGITAKAIAMQLDLADEKTLVLTTDEMHKMTGKELSTVMKMNKQLIFARVKPEDKLRIVERLKANGEVVAVTGDGVNDAPALKRADIGVAMGITGTDVSKEAATMVLTDDSFSTIVHAVEEGRQIYANLRKFVWFIFSCNTGELLTVFAAIILQIPAPLTAVLILAVDLGTDVLPAIALGMDSTEPDAMKKKPRHKDERIMTRQFVSHFLAIGMVVGVLVVGMYFRTLFEHGWVWGEVLADDDVVHRYASTVAFTTLVMVQLVNAFNARSFGHSIFILRQNWYLWGAIAASLGLVLAIVYLPVMQVAFKTVALTGSDWMWILGASLIVLIVEEGRKLLAARTA